VRSHPVAELGEQWGCVDPVVLGYWTNRANLFQKADIDASTLVAVVVKPAGIAQAILLGEMVMQLVQRRLVWRGRAHSGRVGPRGELDDFPDVAPDRSASVATLSKPSNELIEIGTGAPGPILRDGR